MRRRTILVLIAITMVSFGVAGAFSRYHLRTTETRWQIVTFVALAAGAELLAGLSGRYRVSVLRGVLNAAAAAVMIVCVKYHLEPGARQYDSAILSNATASVVRAVASKP
jgi:peptidoglycan/LPS O-acetylase OafA/YrhL